LDGSLGPPKIKDFFSTTMLFHSLDVGDIVVNAHLSPGPGPVFRVIDGQALMPLTVLSAAIVANPHIVASFGKLQVHGQALVILDPVCAIARVAMLDEHGWQGRGEGPLTISSHMERGQDVTIFSLDFHRLPREFVLVHNRGKALISFIIGPGKTCLEG